MATGKTASKYVQILVDGYDLSGTSNNIGSLDQEAEVVDYTSYTDGWNNALLNRSKIAVKGYKGWFNATQTGVVNYALHPNTARVVTVGIGIQGALAIGDPMFAARLLQKSFMAKPELAGAIAVESEYENGGGDGDLTVTRAWGSVLKTNAQITGTTTGAIVDNGAATTNGGGAFLHVTAAGGTWSITIRHSTDNFSANDVLLCTFTANGTAITAEQKAVTGTVNRYLRYVATRTSGNFTGLIGFVRY